jgi:hypothetical protein
MNVQHIEMLVEEASMEAALRELLPRVLGALTFNVYPHSGKRDLLSKLPERLRAYARWLPDGYRIVVVMDRDDDDCGKLKGRLEEAAKGAGLTTRSAARGMKYQVINRLAIEELEAWYFGDWEAVRAAYPRVPADVPRLSRYRDPDAIRGGTWETFQRILQAAGYFGGGLGKIEAARAVARHWDPDRNTSASFQLFRDTVREIAS